MSSPGLNAHQVAALAVLRSLGARLGWAGEAVTVEDSLVFQVPLPNDRDVSGAFFVVEPDELNIRLHLTLPLSASRAQIAQASEFVIRQGYGRRFGALELDLDHGTLRVRMDADATTATLDECVVRLLDRAMALAREVSPAWRAMVEQEAKVTKTFSQKSRTQGTTEES